MFAILFQIYAQYEVLTPDINKFQIAKYLIVEIYKKNAQIMHCMHDKSHYCYIEIKQMNLKHLFPTSIIMITFSWSIVTLQRTPIKAP